MCGIYGFISDEYNQSQLEFATDTLQTRGPDEKGYYFKSPLGLGHRRLSIIDLSSGGQPMFSEDGEVVLVFNGEIYNFKNIKDELIKFDYKFNTNSDTEVIIKSYQKWGLNGCLEKFEGMYSFALWDNKINKLFIVRDRFGEKPLYYLNNDKGFFFASELKALRKESKNELDPVALNLFFSLTYIPAPYSIYRDIRKLEPGSYIEICTEKSLEPKFFSYYDLKEKLKNTSKIVDFDEAKLKLKDLLTESVRSRIISDVPIGSFLSGGIDSSIITCIMNQISDGAKIQTFSIGFKEKEYDESKRAEIIANHIKSNHKINFVDFEDVVKELNDIILYFDEPFGDSSAIPSNEVAKLARKDVKVVLTGDCADELFGGYEKYLVQHYINIYKKLPSVIKILISNCVNLVPHSRFTNKYLRRIKKVINNEHHFGFELHSEMMNLGVSSLERKDLFISSYFSEISDIIKKRYLSYSGSEQDKGFYTDLTTVLEGDMLTKVDRICMRNSLEARVPFLDSKIVEFAFSLPFEFKIKGTNKKYILKETFKDILPKETLSYKKQGFGVPVDYWLINQLKEAMLKFLDSEFIEKQGIFKANLVNKWYTEHLEGKENNKGKLWCYYVFQLWYVNQFDEKKSN